MTCLLGVGAMPLLQRYVVPLLRRDYWCRDWHASMLRNGLLVSMREAEMGPTAGISC